jgi:predicted anti-sigma-YlaC factor YlaD
VDCTTARSAMLEADPSELTGGSGSELSRHLEVCATCRAAATAVLGADRGLAAWLAEARPRGDAGEAVARAATVARRRVAVRRLGTAGSLLAAAAVTILLALPRGQAPQGAPVTAALAEAGQFSVTAPPATNLVVMHTSDPKIVIVWYLPSRRTL